MRKFAVALALTASACSYQSPTQLAASAAATATNEPFWLTLGSSVGSGTTADHATITAKVQGPTGQPLGGVVVTFSTTVGALNPEQAATDSNGIGSTTLVASTAATVTAKAGALSARTGVGTQPAAQPPPTPTPTPAPGPNPGATPTGPLTVTLTAADVIVGSTTTATQACPGPYPTIGSATAKVTATGGSVSGSATTAITVTAPPVPGITINCNQPALPAFTLNCAVSATLNGSPVPSSAITHVD